MKYALATVLISIAVTTLPVHASQEIATKNACMSCHAVDKKVLGPAYIDVAKKYAKDKDALAKVVANIKAGGSGKWGQIPMPAQTALSEADAKALAIWILAGAKTK